MFNFFIESSVQGFTVQRKGGPEMSPFFSSHEFWQKKEFRRTLIFSLLRERFLLFQQGLQMFFHLAQLVLPNSFGQFQCWLSSNHS